MARMRRNLGGEGLSGDKSQAGKTRLLTGTAVAAILFSFVMTPVKVSANELAIERGQSVQLSPPSGGTAASGVETTGIVINLDSIGSGPLTGAATAPVTRQIDDGRRFLLLPGKESVPTLQSPDELAVAAQQSGLSPLRIQTDNGLIELLPPELMPKRPKVTPKPVQKPKLPEPELPDSDGPETILAAPENEGPTPQDAAPALAEEQSETENQAVDEQVVDEVVPEEAVQSSTDAIETATEIGNESDQVTADSTDISQVNEADEQENADLQSAETAVDDADVADADAQEKNVQDPGQEAALETAGDDITDTTGEPSAPIADTTLPERATDTGNDGDDAGPEAIAQDSPVEQADVDTASKPDSEPEASPEPSDEPAQTAAVANASEKSDVADGTEELGGDDVVAPDTLSDAPDNSGENDADGAGDERPESPNAIADDSDALEVTTAEEEQVPAPLPTVNAAESDATETVAAVVKDAETITETAVETVPETLPETAIEAVEDARTDAVEQASEDALSGEDVTGAIVDATTTTAGQQTAAAQTTENAVSQAKQVTEEISEKVTPLAETVKSATASPEAAVSVGQDQEDKSLESLQDAVEETAADGATTAVTVPEDTPDVAAGGPRPLAPEGSDVKEGAAETVQSTAALPTEPLLPEANADTSAEMSIATDDDAQADNAEAASLAPSASANTVFAGPDGMERLAFAIDDATLSPASLSQLEAIAAFAREQGGRLRLLAYAADKDGRAVAARRMALSRALVVRSQLIELGIDSAMIEVRALGLPKDGGPMDRVDIQALLTQ